MGPKVVFVPYKRKSKEEVEGMLKDHKDGLSIREICLKYDASESTVFRIVKQNRDLPKKPSTKKMESKIQKLEKELKQRDREIAILRDILKKS